MTMNGYLDTTVQKAFLPDTPGCLDQYEKLMARSSLGAQVSDNGHYLVSSQFTFCCIHSDICWRRPSCQIVWQVRLVPCYIYTCSNTSV